MAMEYKLDDALVGVAAEKLDQKVSDDHLIEISRSFTEWMVVSPFLGLTKADEEEVREQRDLRRQRIDALRSWKEKQRDRATYRSLVEAFFRAQRLDLVDVTMELVQTNVRAPSPPLLIQPHQHLPPSQQATPHLQPALSHPFESPSPPTHQSQPPPHQAPPSPHQAPLPPQQAQPPPKCSPLAEYGEYLKDRYMRDIPVFSVQWPPMDIKKAFNLAMIKRTKVQRGQISDVFVRMTVTGKVDDILHLKEPVKLEDIFKEAGKKDRKVSLIEGAPGSGKSTLSWDICRRWGAGELFQEYDAVILIQLRDPEVQRATTLADLLPAKSTAMAESVASRITECDGEKVLFVLDGWDELPRDLRDKSLYQQLIRSEKKTDLNLNKSSVIVTSRPVSSGELQLQVSSRVEIIGFTPEELRQYFSECLHNDARAVEALIDRVEENPVVASSCYLPLNAAIIVHLFLSYNESLPTTVHGIFTSLVLCCLFRYQRERLGLKGEAGNLESLDRLPKRLHKPFRQLCTLAFVGVMKDRVTFSSTDLEALSIPTDVSALGLIQAVPSMVSLEVFVYYNFLHLQIQELLAAYHISFLSGSEQISRFQQLFEQPRFSAVFQFYAGITGFRSERWFLSKLAFLLPTRYIPTGIRDVITNMIRRNNTQLLLSVIRCLFEADDASLCKFVARQLNEELDLDSTTLSPLDCLSLGYFLSCVCATTSGVFTVVLRNCSIDGYCCKFLMRGLSRHPTPNTTAPGWLRIFLYPNRQLSDTGATFIAKCLKKTCSIRYLNLRDCGIGNEGVESLANSLLVNDSLEELKLGDNYDITKKGVAVLTECLKTNRGLVSLQLPKRFRSAGVQETVNAVRRMSESPLITVEYHDLFTSPL